MLSHSGWVPLARLSFGAYLLHPVVSEPCSYLREQLLLDLAV
jgi:peptidoglycan/LPS O-acetylase OafA/YrhL